jgi:glycosyltransferase involved in cell wall biosynthesis
MSPPTVRPVSRVALGIPEDAFVLCCVSRAIPEKGWEEAIEAVARSRDATGRDIRLVLVGDGVVHERLVRSEPPPFVCLAGLHMDSVGFYAMANAGIMLTTYRPESFPLTVVDCLFAGRPYIATDMGEIRNMLAVDSGLAGEIIERVDGKVPVDGVARAISRFVLEPETYRSAVDRVPVAARRFTIEAVVRQYLALFERDIRTDAAPDQ